MENIFNNTMDAYNNLKFYLKTKGDKLKNESSRSQLHRALMFEVEGVSWKIGNILDLGNLIMRLEEDNIDQFKQRMEWLEKLGKEFINDNFIETNKHYTYNNRIYIQKWYIIDNIKNKKGLNNRQAFLSIWNREDSSVLGLEEIPCSIGYHFQERDGKLNMNYFMRSLDLNVWPNDVYLSDVVHRHIAERTGLEVGMKSWLVGSLHMFIKE